MNENFTSNLIPAENVDQAVFELQTKIEVLLAENIELKKAINSANEFVSLATHQFRGPLGAIKGYVSLILEGDYGDLPEKVREPLNIIVKSADTLGKTVNDFLDISKIEQGEMRYYLKDFNLADLVQEVVNELKLGIKSDGLELRLNIPKGEFIIHNDKTKLKHVLINLLDNAHKYTKVGWIEISLEHIPNKKILLAVKDSGDGIAPETLPLLFQKFSRAGDADKSNVHGTGLGLYVAKKIVEARHGRIWAESEGLGKGSQFYVELDSI